MGALLAAQKVTWTGGCNKRGPGARNEAAAPTFWGASTGIEMDTGMGTGIGIGMGIGRGTGTGTLMLRVNVP